MAEEQLRDVIDGIRAKLQAELEAQLGDLAQIHEQARSRKRVSAPRPTPNERWSAKLETSTRSGARVSSPSWRAARADVERALAEAVARARTEAEQAAARSGSAGTPRARGSGRDRTRSRASRSRTRAGRPRAGAGRAAARASRLERALGGPRARRRPIARRRTTICNARNRTRAAQEELSVRRPSARKHSRTAARPRRPSGARRKN